MAVNDPATILIMLGYSASFQIFLLFQKKQLEKYYILCGFWSKVKKIFSMRKILNIANRKQNNKTNWQSVEKHGLSRIDTVFYSPYALACRMEGGDSTRDVGGTAEDDVEHCHCIDPWGL